MTNYLLVKNMSLSLLAEVFNRVTNTSLWMLVAWRLGVEAAGALSLAQNYVTLATYISFFGLDQLLIRNSASNLQDIGRYTVNFLYLRFVLSLFSLGGVQIILWFAPYSPETKMLVTLLSLSVLPENLSNICHAVFVAHERLDYIFWLEFGLGILKLVASAFLLWLGIDLILVALVSVFDSILGLMLSLWLVKNHFCGLQGVFDAQFAWKHIRLSIPFFASGVIYILDSRLDVLILSFLRSQDEVGLYGATVNLLFLVMLLPQAYRTAVFAPLARLFQTTRPSAYILFINSFKYLLILALPITVVGAVLAQPIMVILYGNEFAGGAILLRWLMMPTTFLFLNVLCARLILVGNLQWLIARTMGLSLIANITLNLVLVPVYGALGVAITRLVISVLVFISNMYVVQRYILRFNFFMLAWRPVLAAGLMGISIAWVSHMHWLFLIVLGAFFYTFFLFFFGAFTYKDVLQWQSIFLKPPNFCA